MPFQIKHDLGFQTCSSSPACANLSGQTGLFRLWSKENYWDLVNVRVFWSRVQTTMVQSRTEILIGSEFRGILRYKFRLRFLLNLNLQLTNISPPFRFSICIFILQASPNLHPFVLEGLVRTKTLFTFLLGVACSVRKSEASSSPEVRNYDHHR